MKSLTEADNGFYSVTQNYKGVPYEIFSYRLCTWTDFHSENYPHTVNMRGTTFRIDTQEPQLVCLSMEKFHNEGEGDNHDLDYGRAYAVREKADGSLINSLLDKDGMLIVKSKTSFYSDQAKAAQRLLESDKDMYEYVYEMTLRGFTVNMEYCAPENRIVLKYEKPELKLLLLRNRETGETHLPMSDDIPMPIVQSREDLIGDDLVERVKSMEGIEGFVVHLPDRMVKVKTEQYLKLHRAKDSVYNLRNLANIVLHEQTDDLYQLFEDDDETVEHIKYYEQLFINKFNELYNRANHFYKENKGLERKEYAVLGQKELPRDLFSYAMSLYTDRDIEEQIKRNIVKNQPAFEENTDGYS